MITLRGDHTTNDPRLDRLPEFDERSRAYPIRELLPSAPTRGRSWPCYARLDQGQEGACVGFGWAHELAASPTVVRGVDNRFARETIYLPAQYVDEWAGQNYEGTSVLAGAKVLTQLGFLKEYRWAFGIDDVLMTLAKFGPVVLGVPWLESMFTTRPINGSTDRLVVAEGGDAGGHCILARGVQFHPRGFDEPLVRMRNSWGDPFDWMIKASDLEMLLHRGGEACVPVTRSQLR